MMIYKLELHTEIGKSVALVSIRGNNEKNIIIFYRIQTDN